MEIVLLCSRVPFGVARNFSHHEVALKTCIIYGHDGFDVDVLRNLQSLYSGFQYRIAISKRLIPADLLVIQRPPSAALDLSNYSAVHLYDYVANDLSPLLASCLDHPGLLVFASSSARRDELIQELPELAAKISVSCPPVHGPLWMSKKIHEDPKYDVVHIGNYKPYYAGHTDPYASRFLQMIRAGGVHVWGVGWRDSLKPQYWHGRLAIGKVSEIYASSRFALGMMYPHQRTVSLSGRFWHAPLNGCHVISEPGVFAGELPGVVSSDFLNTPEPQNFSETVRLQLREEAANYWAREFRSLEAVVGEHLKNTAICRRPSRAGFVSAYLITQLKNARWSLS